MVAFALGLAVLLAPARADEPILLRYRPELGKPLRTQRRVESVFDLGRYGLATFLLTERVIETPVDRTPSFTLLDVATSRDDAVLNPLAVGVVADASPRVREKLDVARERTQIIAGLLGDRTTTLGIVTRMTGSDGEPDDPNGVENAFLFPTGPLVPGAEWATTSPDPSRSGPETRGIPFYLTFRYEALVVVDGTAIAWISIRPDDGVRPRSFTPLPEFYGAWAVRIEDGVTLRTSRVIRLYGRGSGTIREESALDGAPTWARINAERWREMLAGLLSGSRG